VVWAITEDHAGELWVGTWTDLYSFDRQAGTFRSYQRPRWSPAAVRSLYGDETGLLWVGTQGAGLYRWDGTRFTSYQPQTSNPHNAAGGFIRSIYTNLALDSGAVWAGTDANGLLRFDRATPGGEFRQYTEKDGLAGNECNVSWLTPTVFCGWPRTGVYPGSIRQRRTFVTTMRGMACTMAKHGLLPEQSRRDVHGCTGGLAAFYPEQIKDNALPPPIAITAFRLLNQPEP